MVLLSVTKKNKKRETETNIVINLLLSFSLSVDQTSVFFTLHFPKVKKMISECLFLF